MWQMLESVNYLNIAPLIDLLAAKVASDMYGKSYQEIGEYYGIPCDHSKEELEWIAQENRWAEEAMWE